MVSTNIWQGIYNSFQDAPTQGPGFLGRTWVTNSLAKLRAFQEGSDKDTSMRSLPAHSNTMLPFIAAMLARGTGMLHILDYGGGIGETYVKTRAALPAEVQVDYHIVELPQVCEAGRCFFHGKSDIKFHETLPSKGPFDIAHFGSSLHYLDDWLSPLAQVRELGINKLLFFDLPAGDIPNFVTLQRYYDSLIPVRFFNQTELVASIEALGYSLIYRARCRSVILGEEQPLQLDDFPVTHRLRHTSIMLFDVVEV